MPILFNYKDCDNGAVQGTGTFDCQVDLDEPVGFFAVPKSWSIDPSTVEGAAILENIKLGFLKPVLEAVDFEEANEDTQFKTYSSGNKLPGRKGKPEFTFTYSFGYAWHSAVYSLNSTGVYNVILAYSNNVLGFGTTSDGNLTGLDANYIDVKTLKNKKGSDPLETMVNFQLRDDLQYNQNMRLVDGASNGFILNDFVGHLDLKITIPTLPVDGATTLSAKITLAKNEAIDIRGLAFSDFKLSNNTISASTYNEATGLIDFTVDTPFSSGDVNVLRTNDGTYDIVEAVNGKLYKGQSESFTIA